MAIMCSGKKCSNSVVVFFFICLLVALWLIWFGAGSLLGKAEVEKAIKIFSVQLAEMGNKYNKDIKLKYGDINIEGWGHEKKAVVHNVAIEVSGKSPGDSVKFIFSTDDVTVGTDPYDFQKLLMRVAKPITVSHNGSILQHFVFSDPLLYYYSQAQNVAVQTFHHDFVLPKHIAVNRDEAGSIGEEEFSLDFSDNPTAKFTIVPEHNTNSVSYNFPGLAIAKNGHNRITVGTLKSELKEEQGEEEGRIAAKYDMLAGDIVLYKEDASTKPYAITVDSNVTEDATLPRDVTTVDNTSVDTPAARLSGAIRNREVVINSFTFSNPEFKLTAKGKFANIKGDPLPSGRIDVNIANLPKFLESEIVEMENRQVVEKALIKITGQPLEGLQQISFAAKREQNGVLYIGDTTFEELVASIFSSSFMGNPTGDGRYPESLPTTKLPALETAPESTADPAPSEPVATSPEPSVVLPKPVDESDVNLPIVPPKP